MHKGHELRHTVRMANTALDRQESLGMSLRGYFPYFGSVPRSRSCYLDSAASALKIESCIERLTSYLTNEHANIHRGAYELSSRATESYEEARQAVRDFCNVPESHEVIFTSGATDSLNMVATGLEGGLVRRGDAVMSTLLEHHSNFVPWQQLALRVEGKFCVVGITEQAEIDVLEFLSILTECSPKVVAFTAHSNAFGTLPPVLQFIHSCKQQKAISVVDATQSIVHGGLDVAALDGDFFAFSAHKLYGPTGLGVLIGRKELLEQLRPARFGGGMIREVGEQFSSWADIPGRFEAGTPPIAEAIAFGATLRQLSEIRKTYPLGLVEEELFRYAVERLSSLPSVKLIGPLRRDQRSILSFEVAGVHPHDVASIADSHGVQVRAGHHCVMPAMRSLQLSATTRLSLGMYSVREDVDTLVESIQHAQKILS